jgi:hypothetical protein
MPTIELRKEDNIFTGKTWFYVYKDGVYVSGTATEDSEQAETFYQYCKDNVTVSPTILTVVKSETL